MKIIENKKLFGKINVIDILIVIILLAVLALCYAIFGNKGTAIQNGQMYTFQYEMQNIILTTANSIKVGDKVYDNETNAYIGEVTNVEISNCQQINVNYDTNEYISVDVPGKYNALITIQNNLIDTGTDLTTQDNYVIKVGKRVYLRGGLYAGAGYIVYIER